MTDDSLVDDDDDNDDDDGKLKIATLSNQRVRKSGSSLLNFFRSIFLRSINSWYWHSKCRANTCTTAAIR